MNIFLVSLHHKYLLLNKICKWKYIFLNFWKRKLKILKKNGFRNLKKKKKIIKSNINRKLWNNSKRFEWWESMSRCLFSKKTKHQEITQFTPITCRLRRKDTKIRMKTKIVHTNNLTRKGQSPDQSRGKDEERRKSKNRRRKVLKSNESLNNQSNRIFESLL